MEFSRQEYWSGLPSPSPGESFWPRDQTHVSCVSCIAGRFFTHWAIREAQICQYSSVAQSCPTLCNPMDCSMPGLPVHHQLPEFTQTHVHRVGDAIQPSHPLSSPSPPAFNFPQNQGLFRWVSSSHQVAKVLEFQCQHQSYYLLVTTLHHYIYCNVMMYQISTPALNASTGSTEEVSVFIQWMIQSSQPCLTRVMGATRIRYTHLFAVGAYFTLCTGCHASLNLTFLIIITKR